MWALKSPWISTFGICRNLLLYGNILFWLLSSTITTFITLQQTKINTSWLIHDRQWRNCVTTVTMAIWQSPKDNSRYAILKARVHAAMLLVKTKMPGGIFKLRIDRRILLIASPSLFTLGLQFTCAYTKISIYWLKGLYGYASSSDVHFRYTCERFLCKKFYCITYLL